MMRMHAKTNRLALLTPDKDLLKAAKDEGKGKVRFVLCSEMGMGKTSLTGLWTTFLVSRLRDIPKVNKRCFEAAGDKRFIFFCSNIEAVEDLPEYMSRLRVHNPERIFVTYETRKRSSLSIVRRLVATLVHADDHEGILDARIEGSDLRAVSSPSLKRLRIPVDQMPSLRGHSDEELRNFEIDDDGSFVYWPDLDVHLGWEQLLQAANPAEALKAKQQSADFNRGYGQAVRCLRNEMDLSQEQIEGLTARQVSRIENGECRVTTAALHKLAAAHQMSVSQYMDRLAKLYSSKTQHPSG